MDFILILRDPVTNHQLISFEDLRRNTPICPDPSIRENWKFLAITWRHADTPTIFLVLLQIYHPYGCIPSPRFVRGLDVKEVALARRWGSNKDQAYAVEIQWMLISCKLQGIISWEHRSGRSTASWEAFGRLDFHPGFVRLLWEDETTIVVLVGTLFFSD